jgi:novobiocin biosynthesis protein NovU/D-mycarose 3-C-methyltransferase
VEPARNIARIAEADGVPTVGEFFCEATARSLRAAHGEAAAIVGRHVFAHVDDLHDFLRGIDLLLAPDGVVIIEVPYLGDLLEKLEFDTIYHEHLSYFSLAPVRRLAAMHGLALVDVERVALHGGSMILSLRRTSRDEPSSERLARMLQEEETRALGSPATFASFASGVARWKDGFEAFVDELARGDVRLAGYGAAAKASTLLN